MKKAQISFEFMVLFGILLFIFISVAYLFPGSMDKSSSVPKIAENLARDLKVRAITASLSETDFKSEVIIPDNINGNSIIVEIHAPLNLGDPGDNLMIIKDEDSGRTIARAFLPEIDLLIIPGSLGDSFALRNITIRKENNVLSIERTAYT